MFLDIAVGILLSIGVSWYFNVELTFILILTSVLFALSPDIDFLWVSLRIGVTKVTHIHREILHHPLVFIPIGAIVLIPFGKIFVVTFILAAFWHFLNDTLTTGWGVQWFWPFSKKYYKLLGGMIYQAPDKPKLPLKFFYAWTPEEAEGIELKHGDPNWLKNIYFKLHPLAIVEYLFFIFSVILLIIYKIFIK
ncbi:MAG: metal-dependent hydrolase [Candidatus Azambacteria bacterium]|nr:metal-dependent hydrolase [Candidatus Azambacteria bacterium]